MGVEQITARYEFKIAARSRVWAVTFFYDYRECNYCIWRGAGIVEKGITDKPFTVNAAKVLLIDHLEKINIDGTD